MSRRTLAVTAVILAVSATLFGRLTAADEPKEKEDETRREQQLKNMKRSAAAYALSAGSPKRAFKLQDAALLRFSNPVSGTKDGAIYVWTDGGRPQAVVKLYTFDNEHFTHEWLSLSEGKLVAERDGKSVWAPTVGGLAFAELPDAPKPAETPAERLRQMKTLSAKFTASYTAKHLDGKPFELRLLAQPLVRYEADGDPRSDGALFGFVQSTAPVGLLLLESRKTANGVRWHYAFASMVSGPLTAKFGEKEVFAVEKEVRHDPTQPYLQLHRQPVPKE